tara:strand:- start:2427 stop:3014 length:588 start_codon:yes stop_codon:yes gene_type:complete
MKQINFDVDIDFPDREKALAGLRHARAIIERGDKTEKHNTGVYFQNIPRDPATNLATIDYKSAEKLGYFKVDFLNAGVYDGVKSNEHLDELLKQEPRWDLLEEKDFVELLFHVGDYAGLLKEHKPKSVQQLAMVLAIIRPGKKHLQGKSWSDIEKEVWVKPTDDSYFFKKAHATSYALAIKVQMNCLVEQLEAMD